MNKQGDFTVVKDEFGCDIIPSDEVTEEHVVVKTGTLEECRKIAEISRLDDELYDELQKEKPVKDELDWD